jgi:hypothetical protein
LSVDGPARQVWPDWFPHRAQTPETHLVPDAVLLVLALTDAAIVADWVKEHRPCVVHVN